MSPVWWKICIPLVISTWTVAGYPNRFSCDWTCMSDFRQGGSFGHMGIANLEAETDSNCQIATNVPSTGYVTGEVYMVWVTSLSTPLAMKLASDRAVFAGKHVVDDNEKVTQSSFSWIASDSSDTSFRALCGAGGNIKKMYVSNTLTVGKEPDPGCYVRLPSGCSHPQAICPSGYTAMEEDMDGQGKRWEDASANPSRTIQQCADACNDRVGCTGFEFAEGQTETGQCGTYTGGEGNLRGNANRLADGSNWRSCLKAYGISQFTALQDLGGSGCTASSPCSSCQGDCDSDADCAGALKCFQRQSSSVLVPGCGSGGSGDVATHDYCYDVSALQDLGGSGAPTWKRDVAGEAHHDARYVESKCLVERKIMFNSFCSVEDAEMRFVADRLAPGCYFRFPAGCTNRDWTVVEWTRDTPRLSAEGTDENDCVTRRKNEFDSFCGDSNTQMLFIPLQAPTPAPPFPADACKTAVTYVEPGPTDGFSGWYDVQGCGRCHDYCRWTGSSGSGGDPMVNLEKGNSYWSCRLAGQTSAHTARGHFTSFEYVQCGSEGATTPPMPAAVPATPYVPGTPGAAWTQEEMLIVRAKILRMISDGWNVAHELGLKWPHVTWRDDPDPAKVLRLGFHDCMKYTDGSGGCDGCLDWSRAGYRFPMDDFRKGKFNFTDLNDGHNNGLEPTVQVLEAIYTNRGAPLRTPTLPRSLQQTGKSRADFWAFAVYVAVEYTVEMNNRVCREPEYDKNNCHPRTGMPDCEVLFPRAFAFKTGRKDCIGTGNWTQSYMTSKTEDHPSPHANGAATLDFFKRNFDFNARETVAIMGAHTLGRLHVPISGMRYTWKTRSRALFNNGYYRNIVGKEDLYFATGRHFASKLPIIRQGPCAQAALTNSSGQRPLARWVPHVRGDTKTGGPVQWIQEKFVCPACRLLNTSSAGYQRCCTGAAEYSCKPGCEAWRFIPGVDETALSAEMGLYYSFNVNATDGVPYGCAGFETFNNKYWGTVPGSGIPSKNARFTWTRINNRKAQPACAFNTHADPPETVPVHKIFEQYADDGQGWLADFIPTLERMLENGYGKEDGAGLEMAPSGGMCGFHCPMHPFQTASDPSRFYECLPATNPSVKCSQTTLAAAARATTITSTTTEAHTTQTSTIYASTSSTTMTSTTAEAHTTQTSTIDASTSSTQMTSTTTEAHKILATTIESINSSMAARLAPGAATAPLMTTRKPIATEVLTQNSPHNHNDIDEHRISEDVFNFY